MMQGKWNKASRRTRSWEGGGICQERATYFVKGIRQALMLHSSM
jgi:hypothetical protein